MHWMDQFLSDNGFTTKQLQERQKAFLVAQGFSGNINGAWFRYLRSTGLTGCLASMIVGMPTGGTGLSNQTATFGEQTIAGAGAFKPVDSNGDTVTLLSYDSLVSGSLGVYTPSISGGGLVFTGAAGAPNGAVLRCTHASGTVDITISTRANCYSVLPTTAAIDAALAQITTAGGKDVLVRRGTVGNAVFGWEPAKFKQFTSMVYIEGEGISVSGKGTRFGSLSISWVTGLGFRNIEVDSSTQTQACIQAGSGYVGRIDVEDCWLHGIYNDPTIVHTSGGSFTSTSGGVNISPGQGCVVQRNLIEHVSYGIQILMQDSVTIRDNEIRFFLNDSIQIGFNSGTGTTGMKIIERNVCYSSVQLDGSHPDGIQISSQTANTYTNFFIRQNVIFDTPSLSSGTVQGIFSGDAQILSGAVVCGNILAINHLQALSFGNIVGGVFNNNTLVRFDTTGAGPDYPVILMGYTTGSGAVTVKRNMVDEFNLTGGATYTQANNLTLGNRGATNSYSSVFNWSNPSVAATTFAQLKANLTRNPSGPASTDAGALYSTWFTIGNPRDPGSWSYNSACEV